MSDGPLELTRQRIAQPFRGFAFDLHPGDDERWVTVAAASQPGHLADRVQRLADRHAGHRDVAAAYVAMRAASVVAGPMIGAYLLERRVPRVRAATTWLRTDHQLGFDRLAIGTMRFAGLADDPARGHHDLTVVDPAALAATIVDALADLLGTLLENLRAIAPFGRRGLWGLVADAVGGCALAAARETHTDHRPAWAAANEILDLLQSRRLPVNNRPRPLVVACNGREFPFSIRGTCCLRYKTDEERDHHDADFGAYCHSCPLVDDDILRNHYLHNAHARLNPETARADITVATQVARKLDSTD